MSTQSPGSSLINWIRDLPADVKSELLFLSLIPLSKIVADVGDPFDDEKEQRVVSWLETEEDSHFATLSKILTLKAHINLTMYQRGTTEAWTRAKAVNEHLLKVAKEEKQPEDMIKHVEGILAGIPEREQQWLLVSSSWSLLCEGALSDEFLDNWSMKQIGKRPEA